MKKGDGITIEREERYGRLLLTCDPETFGRLGTLVCQELGIDAPSVDILAIILRPPPPNVERPRRGAWWWINGVAMVMGSGLSGLAMVLGYVVIVEWFMRRLG